jgi:hypothetical protein
MTNQQVVEFVAQRMSRMSLSKIAEAILDHCIADDPKKTGGKGGDNMTCATPAAQLAPETPVTLTHLQQHGLQFSLFARVSTELLCT